MKKLIATAVVAATTYGAFAIETGVRFENLERGATTVAALNADTGTYWSEAQDAANTYNIVAMDSYLGTRPAAFTETTTPENALSVKTTFGKPLSFAVNADGTAPEIGDGIYFDSLIKFTVCEEAPEANLYGDAKIALWLQEQYDEDDNITGTNLVVRAGNLSYSEETIQVVATDYVCDEVAGDFADAWHRVTIKTIADITDGTVVPGFAIYIDGQLKSSSAAKWDESFGYTLSEVADNLNEVDALFPSLKQSGNEKSKIACAQFDGTGSVNELIFTATAPSFASNEQYLDDKFSMTIGDETVNFKTVQAAFAYVNELLFDEGKYYTLQLVNNISLTETITIDTECNFILDLNGNTIENTEDRVYAITVASGTYMTITDSSQNKTGAIVSEDAIAVQNEANLTIEAGIINGYIDVAQATGEGDEAIAGGECIVAGGTLKQDAGITLADGVALRARGDDSGFYDVVPLMVVTFKVDEVVYFTTNVVEGTSVADIVPADPTMVGFTFNGWGFAQDAVVTGDATYTAQWTVNTYYITFVIDGKTTTVTKSYGSTITAEDFTVPAEKTGYTGAWYDDDDPIGDVVSGTKTYTFTYTADTYTITYVLVAESEAGVAPVAGSYTVESGTVKLTQPDAVAGYTFNGWYAAQDLTGGKVEQFTVDTDNPADKTFYGKFTANPPATPEIAPGADSVEVKVDIPVDATPEEEAEILSDAANKVAVAAPSSVVTTAEQMADYQNLFDKKAENVGGKVVVTAEIKETVEAAVAESAVEALSAAEPTVSIPRGLYYKITTMTSLDGTGAAETTTGISTGDVSITKPAGTTSGCFIKIQMGTQEY